MLKRVTTLMSLIILTLSTSAQKPTLSFNEDGKFKIIQITDTHFIYGNPKSDVALELLNEIVEVEKPDLILFTGDMVWQNKDTKRALDTLFEPVIKREIPWAYVFGNHDDEAELTRQMLMEHVVTKPYCLAEEGDSDLTGVGNYVLEIESSDGGKIAYTLFCMDSNAYSTLEGVGTYGWFALDQVEWYTNKSNAYREANGGEPIPALSFFHIPLPEYGYMSDGGEFHGTKQEDECSPKINTGMFAAMRLAGNMVGTFVGHDHDNDYIGTWYEIALAYGRYSGGDTVYNNLGKNGCRVIEITEGVREFTTYLRLLGGEVKDKVHYPTSFKEQF